MGNRDDSPHITSLLQDTARLLARHFDQRARTELGLTRAHCRLLATLSREGPQSPMALAERLDVTPMGLTGLIDRMVEKGLVRRDPNPSDRRSYTVVLTETAEQALDGIFELRDVVGGQLLAGFSDNQRATLERLLQRARANLTEIVGADKTAAAGVSRKKSG